MAMRATYGSPAAGRCRRRRRRRQASACRPGYALATISRCHRPRDRRAPKKANVKVPSSGDDGSNRRLLAMIGAAGLVVVCVALGYVLFGGGSSSSASARRDQAARGRRLHRPDGEGAAVERPQRRGGERNLAEVEHLAADERAALRAGRAIWGCVHGAAAAGPGRAQPRARRHLHPVRQGRPAGDGRRAAGLLRRAIRTAPCWRRSRASARQIAMGVWTTSSPSKPDTGTAHLAKCTTFDEKAYAAFFDAYQFKGPERFPMVSLAPGS